MRKHHIVILGRLPWALLRPAESLSGSQRKLGWMISFVSWKSISSVSGKSVREDDSQRRSPSALSLM